MAGYSYSNCYCYCLLPIVHNSKLLIPQNNPQRLTILPITNSQLTVYLQA